MPDGFKGLRVYNTLTRRKEDFVPLDAGNVRMYVCGPTVYDFAHIGNARPAIVFDVLFRLLRHLYGADHVTYVRNITDVDDKINARALRDFGAEIEAGRLTLNEAVRQVTERTADQYHADVAALGCLEPTVEPRATEFVLPRDDGMTDMASLIQILIDRGHAYAGNGEILFDTASMPDYGALSKRRLEEQQAGARVAVEAHKKNPGDFVLWKQSSAEEPGWEATFTVEGKPLTIRGRPGWHIECSAMSAAYLGEVFDIHGGGLDLIFPHHENEIAQSRCAHGTPTMAKYWMHNGFLQVEGRKMAKSEGNFVTIHDLLNGWKAYRWPGQVIRYAMLKTHYRQPLDFSFALLQQAANELEDFFHGAAWVDVEKNWSANEDHLSDEFLNALKDDLNTPRAIAELHRLSKIALRNRQADEDATAANQLKAGLMFMGLDLSSYDPVWMQKQANAGIETTQQAEIDNAVAERLAFIREKNFGEADRIREELAGEGVQLMDYKDPETGERRTKWEVKR